MDQAIIEKERAAKAALFDHEAKMKALQDKIGSQNISELEVAVKQSAEAKQKALDAFCVDECTRDTVDKAQADFESAEIALARAKELSARITLKSKELFDKFGKLTNIAQRSTQAVYLEIEKDLLLEISEGDAIKSINSAFAANQRSKRPLPYALFIENAFAAPSREELAEVNVELDALKEKLASELVELSEAAF